MNTARLHRASSRPFRVERAGGFTLIEVGVVLVIMTLVVTGLVSMFLSQLVNTQVSSTRNREEAIKIALSTYLARYNRLPCPADPLVDMNSNAYGKEVAVAGCLSGGVTVAFGVAYGMVPFQDLGLSAEATADGYNNRLTYAVTAAHTQVPIAGAHISGMIGNMTMHNTTPPLPANQTNTDNLAVVVVLSHGSNGFGAYRGGSPAGTRVPLPPVTTDEFENTNGDRTFIQKDYSEATVNPFDDIVMWMTPADLLTPLQRDGAMQSPNGFTLDRMRALQSQIDALISVQTIPANVGTVPVTGALILPTGAPPFVDAWGGTIQYNSALVTTSVCGPTAPVIAYTLTSPGPTPATTDDLVLTQYSANLKPRVLQNNIPTACP